ncbi:MAG: hypothetical protein HY908_08580 [Myxococcales bacterium]|nr:hypothetical protein [Myxococcales bacterium]
MANDERAAILLRRRRFLEAGLAGLGATAIGCDKPSATPPRPCLSEPMVCLSQPMPCLSPPPMPVDAGTDAATGTATGTARVAVDPPRADLAHWTWDPRAQRFVPRAPLAFAGDVLDPPPPAPSALDPAVARRMGNLADRFRAEQPGEALAPESAPALDELAAALGGGAWFVAVEVELDPDPNFCGGIPLADRRAHAIRKYLVAHGVAAERSAAHGRSVPADGGICPVVDRFYQKVLVLLLKT